MSKRDDILAASKELFWQRGYESTSPRDIQALSGAGQGSFYHHFHSKRDLACEAISEVVKERLAEFDQDLSGAGDIRQRIDRYLDRPRESLRGCRIGRMVWDSAVEDGKIRKPLHHFFRHIEERLTDALKRSEAQGEAKLAIPAEQIALLIVTTIQGGFTISRATKKQRMDDTLASLRSILDSVIHIQA
jgi:AcrR family transcriptional regulator